MKTSQSIKTISLLIFMALGSSVVFNSCKDDPCDDQICLNGGTCNDGNCDCPVAYEDQNCGTETRSKFISSYNATSPCFAGFTYNIQFVKSNIEAARMNINNLGDIGLNVAARVTGGTNFTIDSQTATDSDGDTWTIQGSGTLNGSIITVNITYTFGGNSLVCTETWTKL